MLSSKILRAPRLSAAVLTISMLLLSGWTAAQADDLAPQIPGGLSLLATGTETGSWESNPLMLFTGAKPLYGSITSPELTLNNKTPTSLLSADLLVNENIFNQEDFDSTDVHQKLGLNEQMERWGASVQEQTDYDTTRTSELFPTGLGGAISNQSVRHLGLSLAPQISYSPSTIDKLSLSGSIMDSEYEKPIFANYGLTSVTPSYTHGFDALNAGIFSVQAQRYQTTSGPPITDDTIGPSIGWIGTLTPRLTAKATVGMQASRQYGMGAVQEPWSLQYTYSGDLAFKGEQDTTHLLTSRADYPFGNGTESLLTTFSVTESHNLNANFSLNLGATYQAASYQSSTTGDLDYLMTGNGGVVYHATDRLDVAATYQYRRETLVSTTGNAQDNMVTLGLTYHPQAWNF